MSALPEILPIFPLTGVLLLPSTRLPLHVFEERYRAMVEDALAANSPIGLIQPFLPADDSGGPASGADSGPPPGLYTIGCAGELESSQKLDDGRYVLLLKGVRRFRVERELPLYRGYRRVVPDWAPFAIDETESLDNPSTERLLHGLRAFGAGRELELDFEALEQLPGEVVLNGIAAALPFRPAERQALLEAADLKIRLCTLLDLLAMDQDPWQSGGTFDAPN